VMLAHAQMRGAKSGQPVSIKVAMGTPATAKAAAGKAALGTASSTRGKTAASTVKTRVASAAR
jgi:hypothetical protein